MKTIASHTIPLLFMALATGLMLPDAQAENELEQEFSNAATDLLQQLSGDNIKTTGVLKFSVRIGRGQFPGNVGTLNTRLAEKLEIALVLANPAEKAKADQQVGVVHGASDVAATINGATHLGEDGRRLLFSKKYPLAWKHRGLSEVTPDSLIVGVAEVADDLSSMTVELMLLTRHDLQLKPLARFTAPTDISDLIDGGESFSTRGLFDGGTVEKSDSAITESIRQEALLTRIETIQKTDPQPAKQHPLASSKSPVKFEIWYDDDRQPIEFRNGAAFVKEPYEGQNVVLVVRRNGADKTRYGIIVRVNGENTLYRERSSDSQSSLWILEPDLDAFSIRGFQMSNDQRQRFRVLSPSESDDRKFDYGRDIGLISITVYPEQTGLKPLPSDHELELAVQSEASLPEKTVESRGELGTSLFAQLMDQSATRGIIVEGKNETAEIDTVEFEQAGTAVMSASVRYYKSR